LRVKSLGLLVLATLLFAAGTAECRFYTNGPKDGGRFVALTFDDGPGQMTPDFLAVLEKQKVKATFFMSGSQVKYHPEEAKLVAKAGHEIGSHTTVHRGYHKIKVIDEKAIKILTDDIKQTEAVLSTTIGIKPHLLRFPYGYCKKWAIDVCAKLGYDVINWSYGYDWTKLSDQQLLDYYVKNSAPGAIILMHDGWKVNRVLALLPKIIEDIRAKGYEFVTVSELLKLEDKGKGK